MASERVLGIWAARDLDIFLRLFSAEYHPHSTQCCLERHPSHPYRGRASLYKAATGDAQTQSAPQAAAREACFILKKHQQIITASDLVGTGK